MVSSVPVDAISDPTRSLLDLYDANPHIDDFPAKVAVHFADIFASKDAFSEIPSIYTVDPRQRDRCLVSFRAMIQDTSPSPEMYLAKRSNGQCGGWGLADDASPDDINYADLRENTVVWAVNVPGESEWVASELDGPNVPSFTRSILPESHHPHKFPIPGAPHLGVQVKVYDTSRADLLKSTDVVTLVGILTMESISSDSDLEPENDVVPVPTLHVLFSPTAPSATRASYIPVLPGYVSNLETLRDELISWIATEGLAGDKDAAEWVLLNIIAKPHTVLSHLLPIVVTLPLSLDLLNTSSFSPESKNEELCSGQLQLPRGTTCIGGLVERGIVNLRALQEIMTNQSLEYVFPFSRFAFQTDVACLVLAEGRKSTFFQTHINVPLRPEAGKSAELYKPANQVQLPDYLGAAKIGSVTIGDTYIQEDFVKERKAAATPAAAVTSEHLIHRMTIARLLTLSMHQSEVSIDIWERAKAMEAARETRLGTLGTQ
ncbi:mini-chromosome maintenance replisome factor-domain-containing protein [Mycena olivaceomarginata]|nr:mini-chromosome maintenance replisome factor-domain-containing protein [Mycena olivaceomarginata]